MKYDRRLDSSAKCQNNAMIGTIRFHKILQYHILSDIEKAYDINKPRSQGKM